MHEQRCRCAEVSLLTEAWWHLCIYRAQPDTEAQPLITRSVVRGCARCTVDSAKHDLRDRAERGARLIARNVTYATGLSEAHGWLCET